jgi:hypothetical protein
MVSALWLLASCGIHSSVAIPDDNDGVDPGDSSPGAGDSDVEVVPGDTSPPGDSDAPPEGYQPGTPDVVVDCNGAGDFATISEAIDASVSGTKIGLAPCTYYEDIDFIGKTLDIFGIDGLEATTIQGIGRGAVVTAARGEGPGTRLAGVTITGGGGSYGSGLYATNAVLELDHVDFVANRDAYAVIYAIAAPLTLTDVSLRENTVSRQGGIVVVDNGFVLAQRLTIDCGPASYGIYQHNVTLLLDSELACDRTDAAVVVSGGEFHARRSRIEGGTYGIYGTDKDDTRNERMRLYNTAVVAEQTAVYALYMHVKADHGVFWGGSAGANLERCHAESFVTNSAIIGGSCPLQAEGTTLTASFNAFGNGDACRVDSVSSVTGDPGFVDAPADFQLAEGSPLIDAGNPDRDEEDVDGSRSDIGIHGGPEGAGEL